MELLRAGERLEDLGYGVRAIVSDEYAFGIDALLLADFAAPRKGQRICELGTGCGIIPLMLCRGGARNDVDAFELQPQAADIALRAMRLNGIDSVRVINRDIKTIGDEYRDRYDLVICNPPFRQAGTGGLSKSPAALLARHEAACTLEDAVRAARMILRGSGRFCLCHRPERLCDLLTLLRQYRLEPKTLRLVQQDAASKPWLVLVEARKGARPGLAVPPVLLYRENGGISGEIKRLFGK